MGKRSRKRSAGGTVEVDDARTRTSRAERDAARERRAEALRREGGSARPRRRPGRTAPEDRPPAPWGNFPLVELAVLGGLILIVAGFIVRGNRGGAMFAGGLAVASLAGLELAIREHFGGFRSHSSLLAGGLAALAMGIAFFVIGTHHAKPVEIAPIGAGVFVAGFWIFRRVFMRRTGGVGFRR